MQPFVPCLLHDVVFSDFVHAVRTTNLTLMDEGRAAKTRLGIKKEDVDLVVMNIYCNLDSTMIRLKLTSTYHISRVIS